ncbi:MAG TPA: aminopeptidase, partial [Planctomycetota bacterium]
MKPVRAALPFLALFATLACSAPTSAVRAPDALAPEASRLAQDVRWLAADAREGRRAGTSGEAEAARWIAQRMEALGLEPAGSEGYFQGFEVPLPPRDGGGSRLEASVSDMRLVSEPGELVPLFCSAGGTVEGPLVFAGYGIADADLGRDDFAG